MVWCRVCVAALLNIRGWRCNDCAMTVQGRPGVLGARSVSPRAPDSRVWQVWIVCMTSTGSRSLTTWTLPFEAVRVISQNLHQVEHVFVHQRVLAPAKSDMPLGRYKCRKKSKNLVVYIHVQVCLDDSSLYNSESTITRTTFGRQNPACRLNCVSRTRNPL